MRRTLSANRLRRWWGAEFVPFEERSGVRLTKRERQVLYLIGQGYSVSSIAQHLELSVGTVHCHLARLKAKLHVTSAGELWLHAAHATLTVSPR
jgi:DNA-binding NarL/FixJ family response regulator